MSGTAIKRADSSGRIGDDLYRELFSGLPDPVFLLDAESLQIVDCSIPGAELLATSRESLTGRCFLEFQYADDKRTMAALRAAEPTGTSVSSLLTRERTSIEVELHISTVRLDGRCCRLVAVHPMSGARSAVTSGITERRTAERAIRESEGKFRAVTETASSAIFIYQDGRFRYVNEASERITGYSANELMEMYFWQIVHPEHREMVRRRGMARQLGGHVPSRYEFKIVTKAGEMRWLDFTASVIEFEGKPAALGTAFDVTERRHVQEQLEVEQAYLEELFQSAPEGVVVLNAEGNILRANREFLRMFGYFSEQVLGAPIDPLIVPADRAEESGELTRAMDEGRQHELDTVRHRSDGTLIHVSILGTPVNVAQGQVGRYVIYRDISAQKRADRIRDMQFATTRILAESVNLPQAISRLLETICLGLGWECGRMWRSSGDQLVLQSSWKQPGLAIALPEPVLPSPVAASVFVLAEPVWVADLSSETGETARRLAAAGLRSCFGVPIRHGTELAGVMEFLSPETRQPDFDLLKATGDIGSQFGLFLDRRLAEQALVESEAKFRALADTVSSAIYIHSGDRFLYVNRASQDIIGYSREELMATSVWDVIHPDDRQMIQTRATERQRGVAVPPRYEFRMVRKDGEVRWVDFSATVIQFEGHSSTLATVFDITERKRSEQLQAALYRIARLASEATDLGQCYRSIHEIVGELMYARNLYIAVLSEDGSEIEIPYFVDEEDEVAPPPEFRRGGLTEYVLRSGQPLLADPTKFEELVRLGEVISRGAPSIDWMGVPLKVGDNTFGVLTVQSYNEKIRFSRNDVEILMFVSQQVASAIEHSRSQEALRRSEQRYRSQVQSAVYGIYRSSVDGRFLDANPALVQMLGYDSAEELCNLDMATQVYAEPGERLRILAGIENLERIECVETRWKRRDGRVITVRLSGRGGLKYPGEPQSFEMIAEDVTERRALEDQLLHSQKMEAVGRLAGGVAHDFNNLLTVIKGYSDLMLNELPGNDPMCSEVEEIRRAAERAASLTRQLLAFSRRQVMAPRVIDLNSVVNNMQKLLRRLLGEDIDLRVAQEQNLGHIKADPGQIEQVVMNLAVNARDAMPKGGKLTIETANCTVDEAYAREHAVTQPGAYAVIVVSDSGSGMDPETASHIFEPFFTTKEMGKGTGLGLSTVYGIVKQSGGYIWVYSEPGIGTTFKIYFPIVEGGPEQVLSKPAPTTSYRGTETILLVEDEDGVRALIREVLQRHGYRVIETRNGGEALLQFERRGDEINMLLTDVVLAEVSGRDIAKRLTALRPHLKVLFVSGYTEEAIVHHGVLEPGTAFLQKPFTPSVLARKVREVLEGKELE